MPALVQVGDGVDHGGQEDARGLEFCNEVEAVGRGYVFVLRVVAVGPFVDYLLDDGLDFDLGDLFCSLRSRARIRALTGCSCRC